MSLFEEIMASIPAIIFQTFRYLLIQPSVNYGVTNCTSLEWSVLSNNNYQTFKLIMKQLTQLLLSSTI